MKNILEMKNKCQSFYLFMLTCKISLLKSSVLVLLEFWMKNFQINSYHLLYTRCNTPKRVTSLRGPSPRHCARATSFFRRNVAAVASRWQHCVRFDRPEIKTPDLPLQRQTCYRSANWPVLIHLLKTLQCKLTFSTLPSSYGVVL